MDEFDPLPHPQQAEPLAGLVGLEPLAVVAQEYLHAFVLIGHPQLDAARVGVLDDIRQSFLRQAISGRLDIDYVARGIVTAFEREIDLEINLQA